MKNTEPHTYENAMTKTEREIGSRLKAIRRAIEADPDNLELYMEWSDLELTLADLNGFNRTD